MSRGIGRLATRVALNEQLVALGLFSAGFYAEAALSYEVAAGCFEEAGMVNSAEGARISVEDCKRRTR